MTQILILLGGFGIYYILYHTKLGEKIINFIVEILDSF